MGGLEGEEGTQTHNPHIECVTRPFPSRLPLLPLSCPRSLAPSLLRLIPSRCARCVRPIPCNTLSMPMTSSPGSSLDAMRAQIELALVTRSTNLTYKPQRA